MPPAVAVRPLLAADAGWARGVLEESWGSGVVARRGELVDASALPGFVAFLDDDPAGLAVAAPRGAEYEVVSLAVSRPRRGVGRALMQACVDDARARGCRRLWLTTTNNNVRAFGFYQRFGMDLCAFRRFGVDESRRVKPSIPAHDELGVPIAHELDFELLLTP